MFLVLFCAPRPPSVIVLFFPQTPSLSVCPALDSDPGDVKARFRRSQALQKLGRLDQAFKDIQRCAQLEPKNMTFQESLRQLGAQIQDKVQD